MAKFSLFSALFLLFGVFSNPLWATGGSPTTSILQQNPCYAPAPDSFRITEVGSNYIRLEWQSVAPGLSYSLEILRKNSAGGWDPLYALTYITDNFYDFQNNDPEGTIYRFRLRTNCSVGDPSTNFTDLDGINTILELTIGGRTPINPQPTFCTNIPLSAYEWVGFKVSKHVPGEGVVSSLFEYDESENDTSLPFNFPTKLYLKRVEADNLIVASNDFSQFPQINEPKFNSPNPTYMRDFGNLDDIQIGKVGLIRKNLLGPRISICKDQALGQPDWKWDEENYIFQPMIAFSVVDEFNMPQRVASRGTVETDRFMAKNPFSGDLVLNYLNYSDENSTAKIRFLNIEGQVVFDQTIYFVANESTIPLSHLPSGMYVVSIETPNKTTHLKLIKSN